MEIQSLTPWTQIWGSPAAGPEWAFVALQERDTAALVARARRAAAAGKRVRVVCRGALSPWNEALFAGACLLATEVDAYLPAQGGAQLRQSLAAFDAWLAQVFSGVVPEPAVTLGGSAALRLDFDARRQWEALLLTLSDLHGERVVCLGAPPVSAGVPYAAILRAAVETLALRVWERFANRRERAVLRARAAPTDGVRTWLGVIGDWPRSSRQVLRLLDDVTLRRELLGTDAMPGILLQDAVRPGHRRGAFAAEVTAGVLPSLAGRDEVPVAQCVEAEAPLRLLFPYLRALLRVLRQLRTHTLLHARRQLALLCTRDLWRALEVAHAARAFVRTHPVATIVWSHASLVADASADWQCRAAGVKTVEWVHGSLAAPHELVGFARTAVSEPVYATAAEAAYVRQWVPRARALAVPRPLVERTARALPPRVLLLSNYATALGAIDAQRRPRRAYQCLLLQQLAQAQRMWPCQVTWRPHPGDDPALVEADHARFAPGFTRSEGTLADALAEADLVVSSLSSAIVEAASAGLPVLVHAIPAYERAWLETLFGAERLFASAAELVERLHRPPAAELSARLGLPRT